MPYLSPSRRGRRAQRRRPILILPHGSGDVDHVLFDHRPDQRPPDQAEFVNRTVDSRGGAGEVMASNNHREQHPDILVLGHLDDRAKFSLEEPLFGQRESQSPQVTVGMGFGSFG